MSMDAAFVQRLSLTIAQALAQAVAPLNEEIARLRAEVESLRQERNGDTPLASPAARRASAALPLRTAAAAPAAPAARRGTSADAECRVPHCEAAVLAKELCETHYRVMRRALANGERFDPAKQKPAAAKPVARGCSEPDCDDGHYARGLCRRHYMTLRARERAAERGGGAAPAGNGTRRRREQPAPAIAVVRREAAPAAEIDTETIESTPPAARPGQAAARAELMNGMPFFELAVGGEPGVVAMPTAEAVMRVMHQYRGGLGKVAEVLGRNRQTLMELLERLNLLEAAVTMRKQECSRILRAPLRERLSDLLFREKLLEDLKCLKEVDESARTEIQVRCAQLAKTCNTQEEAFAKLAQECGLEESGLKRLIWRYDLRRQLRGLKSTRPAPSRMRN
jgi:hypothetical protein